MFGYSYPVLGAFWTMFIFFLWIMWFFLLFRVIVDIFRSHEMKGLTKAIWLIFVLVLPFLGVLVYVIARGDHMARHDMAEAQAQDEAMRAYVRNVAGSTSSADELVKLADLKAKGVISDAEFAQMKAKIVS